MLDRHSLDDFRERGPEFLRQLKETGEPVVLTVDGKAALIVQDAEEYRKLLAIAEEARFVEAVRLGFEDLDAGRTVDLDTFKEHVRTKFGFSV